MALVFALVDGVAFAADASSILDEAWKPPSLRYSPAYLCWQLSFPSRTSLPCAAAFDGSEPVGFAGASARTVRLGSRAIEAAIVSFVAVRPRAQGRGVAAGLYRTLLQALAGAATYAITWAIPASAGERAILRAYPEAGYRVHSLGEFATFGFAGSAAGDAEWRAFPADDLTMLDGVVGAMPPAEGVLWSMPGATQSAHYGADPRPRALIVTENRRTGARGAAFVVRSEIRTRDGIARLNSLDSVWLPDDALPGLHAMLRMASVWPGFEGPPAPVVCPNLCAFTPAALRAIGVRKTGGLFSGYWCAPPAAPDLAAVRTNLEIV